MTALTPRLPSVPHEPTAANAWLADHTEMLLRSYRHWTGRDLIDPQLDAIAAAHALYTADFAVLSHDAADDPVFTYANLTAQRLFERGWGDLVGLPSRYSAEPMAREARARLLEQVARQGYTADYTGIRISASGRRFRVMQATVWNLLDAQGAFCGQAASFAHWQML